MGLYASRPVVVVQHGSSSACAAPAVVMMQVMHGNRLWCQGSSGDDDGATQHSSVAVLPEMVMMQLRACTASRVEAVHSSTARWLSAGVGCNKQKSKMPAAKSSSREQGRSGGSVELYGSCVTQHRKHMNSCVASANI
jgi:hypothetical protein